ncbi:MAG: CRISPR-associated endonuclease Cas1 [Methanogenium sp.]
MYSLHNTEKSKYRKNLRNYSAVCSETIDKIEFEELIKANDISELMGIEGRIRYNYYKAFSNILNDDFGYKKRTRPPTDPINALISFGNSLMYTTVLGEIYKTQLDPTISYLHEPSTKRFSLSLDIAEIFKPLIIDTILFTVINKKIITNNDFTKNDGICMLNEKGKRKFIEEYEKKLSTTIKHRKLNRHVSYRGFIRLECYKLIKYFIGDDIYTPLRAWW